MTKFRIERKNGRVIVKDEFETRLNLIDDERLKDSINNVPGLKYWERVDLLRLLGLDKHNK